MIWDEAGASPSTSHSLVFCTRDLLPLVLPPASQILGEARRSLSLLLVSGHRCSSARARAGGAPRLPHAGAGSLPGAGELRLPRLRMVMPGLGAGAPPPSPSTRSLPPSSPPQALSKPQPSWLRTADTCRPPHSRRRPQCSASPSIPEPSRCFPGTLD